MVRKAGQSKSRAQDFADRAAFWLTVAAVTGGAVTLAAWLALGREFDFALERTVTVMVIACPHALGLAIPLVVAVVTSMSAKRGLLIRNRTAFESAFRLDTIVFDKTGTLTKGEFEVSEVAALGGADRAEVLRLAASVERESEHRIAAAVVKKAEEEDVGTLEIEGFEAVPGKGARAVIDGQEAAVGSVSLIEGHEGEEAESAGSLRDEARRAIERMEGKGMTTVVVLSGGGIVGVIGLSDTIREGSRRAVGDLKGMGFGIALITGDSEAAAEAVAGELGIDEFYAGVLPDKKSERIAELQREGRKVAMVGDGVNDAPALARADVGIAIGTGTDVAVETADVVLVEDDPRDVVGVVSLSRATRRKMWQNLVWATGYNLVALPLAAGVLYGQGIVLAPAMGALIMSLSTVIVAVNARLLRVG